MSSGNRHPTLRSSPASTQYSTRYQRDLTRCWKDIALDLTHGVAIDKLVRRARTAYQACWRRELVAYRDRDTD